jgi:hypothetical protein
MIIYYKAYIISIQQHDLNKNYTPQQLTILHLYAIQKKTALFVNTSCYSARSYSAQPEW